MMSILQLLYNRLLLGLTAFPTLNESVVVLFITLLMGLAIFIVGRRTGFLEFRTSNTSFSRKLGLGAVSFFVPALAEEVVFRGLQLPHRTEAVPVGVLLLWYVVGVVLFVAYHPLKTLLPTCKHKPFNDPVFLTLAALLGIACTIAYHYTGSIWASAFVHWFYVLVWLLFLEGYRKMSMES